MEVHILNLYGRKTSIGYKNILIKVWLFNKYVVYYVIIIKRNNFQQMYKFINWFKATGISNLFYAVTGIAAIIMGYSFFAGVSFGIFGYINYNVIRKIVSDKLKEEGG